MVEVCALLAASSVLMLFYGIRGLSRPAYKVDRFKARSYSVESDEDYMEHEKELREIEKLYKVDNSKKILLLIAASAACGAIGYSISGQVHISLASCLFGFAAPAAFEKWHADGQRKLLEKQFEQAAEQMAIVIKSGGSIQSAIEKAAEEAKYPLKKELEVMSAQTKLNMPPAQVFLLAKEKIPVPELEMLVMVFSLQQQGMAVNAASVLERVEESIRARRAFREQISAITSEGRLSSKVVGVMPFLVIGFIRKVAPEFMDPLFTTAWGMALLAGCVISILVGMAWINRMIRIE